MFTGKTPFLFQVEAAWMTVPDAKIEFNKVVTVDQSVQDANPR